MSTNTGKKIAGAVLDWLPDALTLGGIGAVCYGAWLLFPPAAWVIGGVAAISVGALLAWKA